MRKRLSKLVGKLVIVHWRDAVGSAEWHSINEAKEIALAVVVTTGRVLNVDKDVLRLYSDRDNQGNVCGIGVIPLSWIERVETDDPFTETL